MMDTRIIDYPIWQETAAGPTFFDESRGVLFQQHRGGVDLICRDGGADYRLLLMRVIREYAMGAAQQIGGRFLHASAVAADGQALIITGPRGAGKTSLLTCLLKQEGAGYLSNDRVLVNFEEAGTRLQGMPTVVSMRDGTLDLFPTLRDSLQASRFNSRLTLAGSRAASGSMNRARRPGKQGVSPAQYCALMNCRPVCKAAAAALIFPQQTGRTGGIVLRPLASAESLALLPQALFGYIGPASLSRAFTLAKNAGELSAVMGDEGLLARLASSLPAYICELGTAAYADADGVSQLMALLRMAPARSGAGSVLP
jgi:hypothetical protein